MRTITIVCLILLLLVACSNEEVNSEPNLEGYTLEVEEKRILVAEEISPVEYEKIKGTPIEELDKNNLHLIYISYRDAKQFDKGDQVEVWLDGEIETSNPAQTKAKKITLKEK